MRLVFMNFAHVFRIEVLQIDFLFFDHEVSHAGGLSCRQVLVSGPDEHTVYSVVFVADHFVQPWVYHGFGNHDRPVEVDPADLRVDGHEAVAGAVLRERHLVQIREFFLMSALAVAHVAYFWVF